jgi:hypothetical protein
MRKLLFVLLLLLSPSLYAQKPAFFRVYDSRGKKVAKGNIFTYSDTSLTLTRKNRFIEIPLSQIHVIKYKRTTGHRVAMTTLTVAGIGFIAVATLFTLNNGGYRNVSLGPRTRTTRNDAAPADSQKLETPLEKPPRPAKKYKVKGDAKKWEETRKGLYYYIV